MKCGRCKKSHDTVGEVRACYGLGEPDGTAKGTGQAYPDVPAGYYAVKSITGNNDLDFFEVDRPTEGKWAGYTFVNQVIGGKPSAGIKRLSKRIEILQAILDVGWQAAARTYGLEIGRCYKCNRHLTDEVSRQLGIGPTCRSMLCQLQPDSPRWAKYGKAQGSFHLTGSHTL